MKDGLKGVHPGEVQAKAAEEAKEVGVERSGEEGRFPDPVAVGDAAGPSPIVLRVLNRQAGKRIILPSLGEEEVLHPHSECREDA